MTDIRALPLAETEYGEWNALVQASPDGGIYSTPEYLDALCSAAGGSFRILGLRAGSELTGGVGLYERRSAWGPYVSPRLLLYYNGPVLRRYDTKYPSEATSRTLRALDALCHGLRDARYGMVRFRCSPEFPDVRPFIEDGWRARPSYTYVVDLRDPDAVRDRIAQNLRRLIKRCVAQDLTVTDDDDFAGFYRLHRLTMERIGTSCYLPEEAFAKFVRTLRGQGRCRLFHARLPSGQPVASLLVLLGPHPVAHTVTAGSDPEFAQTGASAFLRAEVFQTLAAMGYQGNDLTDAELNSVTRFKSQLGPDLRLSLILESPLSRAFRAGEAGAAVGRLARRVAARFRPTPDTP